MLLACTAACELDTAALAGAPRAGERDDAAAPEPALDDARVPEQDAGDGSSSTTSGRDAYAARPDEPAHDAAVATPVGSLLKIMIVGDSITQGSAGDFSWRYRLDKQLTTAGVRFDLVGTRDDLFDNIENVQGSQAYADRDFDRDHDAVWGGSLHEAKDQIREHVSTTRADVLLILLGTNDLTFFSDAPHSEQDLRTLIANARAANAQLSFVLGRVLPKRAADATFVAAAQDLNTRLVTLASSLTTTSSPITIARTDEGYDTTLDSYDGVHPNASGEQRIAAAFSDALSTALHIGAPAPRPLPAVPIGPQTVPTLHVEALDGAAQLSWTTAPGATGYYIWMRNVSTGESSTRLPIAVESPWTASQLSNGTSYEFRVQPTKWDAAGVLSSPAAVVPQP
jgi:lysophospholipase L1-like esterase